MAKINFRFLSFYLKTRSEICAANYWMMETLENIVEIRNFYLDFSTDLDISITHFGFAIGLQLFLWGLFGPLFGIITDKYGGNVAMFATGGLNFQIEHHVFPRLSSWHYPRVSGAVKKCCERHGVKYNYFPL